MDFLQINGIASKTCNLIGIFHNRNIHRDPKYQLCTVDK